MKRQTVQNIGTKTANQQRGKQMTDLIEQADGSKEWYKDDKRHREDGPAIEQADGTTEWYKNGEKILPIITS